MSFSAKPDRTDSLCAYDLKRAFESCKVCEPELQDELQEALRIIGQFLTGDGLIPAESDAITTLWRIALDLRVADKGPRNALSSMLGDQALILDYKLGSGSIYDVADRAMFASDELYDDSLELEYQRLF